MKCPDGLTAAGKRAWTQAKESADEQVASTARFEESINRFARAVDLSDRIRREWIKLKRPLLSKGGATGRVLMAHPLVEMIAHAERNAARFGRELGLDPMSRKSLGAIRGRPQERVPPHWPRNGEPPKVVPLRKNGRGGHDPYDPR